MTDLDCIIIGGGPAGLTAATYLRRLHRRPARGELARLAGAHVDNEGAVVTNEHMETSRTGLFAVGDVVSDLNQIAVAFGHAAIAASAIHRSLPPAPR